VGTMPTGHRSKRLAGNEPSAEKSSKRARKENTNTSSARGRENPQGESPCPQLSGALLAHNRSMVGPYKLDGTAGSAGS
jgi:hypothetical protein